MDDSTLASVYPGTLDCVHCGLCLSACPTYIATGRENSSPRGRVRLMRGVAEGEIPLDGLVVEEAALCLGCRACETACPSGVRFGAMLEQTRAQIRESGLRGGFAARLERLLLRSVIPHRRRLHALVGLLAAVRRLGLDRLRLGSGASLPPLPYIPPRSERVALPAFTPARGERRGCVALFEGCVMPELFGEINRATLRVLAHNGFDVRVPPGQTCCGALHAHAGDPDLARELAFRNITAFGGVEVDAVISNSAGCGAALREAGDWIGKPGRAFSGSVRDLCEFLDSAGLRVPSGRFEATVCYDDPCHLIHAQAVSEAPRRILSLVPGLELRPHQGSSDCCGAAGTYSLTQPEMSRRVLERKLDALADADPDIVVTGNPGCILQLRSGLAARSLRTRVLHPVEILDAAYGPT